MEDRKRMAAEAVAIYEELFETFKGRLASDPKWTESRMHELMDATFEEVRGLDLPGVSTADEVIVLTDPHYVEEFFHRDWASRARHKVGVPVLKLFSHSKA